MRIDVQEGLNLVPARTSASTLAKNVVNSNRSVECTSVIPNGNQGLLNLDGTLEFGLEVEVHNMLILDQTSFDGE